MSQEARGRGWGGSPGRVLKHPPALSMPLVWVQKAAQKNPAERKGLCEGLSLPVLPSPRSYFGAAAAGCCIVVGLKGAEMALSEPRSHTAGDYHQPGLSGKPQPRRADPHKSYPLPFEPGLMGSLCRCPG